MHLRSVGEHSLLWTFLCLVLSQMAWAQNCESNLEVFKDRHTRSVILEDPTRFYFVLTNRSDRDQLYTLSVNTAMENCNLEAMPAKRLTNTDHLSFQWKNNQGSGNQLKLKAGQSANFQLQIALLQPLDDPQWQCLSVVARTPQCRDGSITNIRLWMEPQQTDNY